MTLARAGKGCEDCVFSVFGQYQGQYDLRLTLDDEDELEKKKVMTGYTDITSQRAAAIVIQFRRAY